MEPHAVWNVAAPRSNGGCGYVARVAIDDGVTGLARIGRVPEQGQTRRVAKGATGNNAPSGAGNQQGPLGGLLGNLGGALAGGGAGGLLSGGLGELLERFKQNGQGDAAESWINKGTNKELAPLN